MMTPTPVLEVALFTVKPASIAHMPQLRDALRQTLKDFPGVLSYHALQAHPGSDQFADLVRWDSLAHAKAAQQAFEQGDPRFLPYMQAIERLDFMGHYECPEPF